MTTTLTAPPATSLSVGRPLGGTEARPLDELAVESTPPGTAAVAVLDAAGREYARVAAGRTFAVGGALGTHTARALDAAGKVLAETTFAVDATTTIDDAADAGGRFAALLAACDRTMRCYSPTGVGSRTYRGRQYPFYVHWILDHTHTAKGMQFFAAATAGLVDLLADVQREDGMIWSFADEDRGPGFFDTRDKNQGYYTRRLDGLLLVRQPTENHCEYNFVDAMHLAWKSSGDDAWMTSRLDNAIRALNYTMNDRSRWSDRFQLLKRGYTIDSWDFQVHDEYAPDLGIGSDMLIDPDKTKFGVFFGDNHGYALACDQLAEMLRAAGRTQDAEAFERRGQNIRDRLTKLTWNGQFFRHRVEEDDSVRRDLGVDESKQIAMSNCYATNRHITGEQAAAIFQTYQQLRKNAPPGSPGEWYAIYPPFGKGFGGHNGRWQYMNGGVHGHAAGELARGAFEHGHEAYGADQLDRLLNLAREHAAKKHIMYGEQADVNLRPAGREPMIYFAYTGGYDPAPPPQTFAPLDVSPAANMSKCTRPNRPAEQNWMHGNDVGNDLHNLPAGRQTFANVPFDVPAGENAAVAVSAKPGFARSVTLPMRGEKAGAVYLLHTVNSMGPSGNAGAVTLCYADGSEATTYIQNGKHVTGWWFPSLGGKDAGVAWVGPNDKSTAVGLCWAAIANPHPDKPIKAVRFDAALDGAVYAVMGLTLADRMPYHRPGGVSFGGPDNWAGGCVTLALIEGLAGVADAPDTTAYAHAVVSPRWPAAGVDSVDVTVRRPASAGYVAYQYRHDSQAKTMTVRLAASGRATLRLLLPAGATRATSAAVDGMAVTALIERVGGSTYAVLDAGGSAAPRQFAVAYA